MDANDVLVFVAFALAFVALLYWFDDPCPDDCPTKIARRLRRSHDHARRYWKGAWCSQHQVPKHECRDDHRP